MNSTNIPEVKLGIVAVSRDCFPIALSEKRRAAIAAACTAKINGIPTTKYQCLVLWWNRYMPAHAPALPPSRAAPNSAASGTRHWCRLARRLSSAIISSAAALIITRYPANIVMAMVFPLSFSWFKP